MKKQVVLFLSLCLLQCNNSKLPEDNNTSISTETSELINDILDNPSLAADYMVSSNSSPIGTVYRILARSAAFAQLEQRNDRAAALYSYYKTTDIDNYSQLEGTDKNKASIRFAVLEVLFTKPAILSQFDAAQKQELIALLLERYKQTERQTPLTVLAWIIYDSGYEPLVDYFGKNIAAEWFEVLGNQTAEVLEIVSAI